VRPRAATEEVQTNRLVFRKGVDRKMGFGKHAKSGNAAFAVEFMPARLADRMQIEVSHDRGEERTQDGDITQRTRSTALGLDNPFDSMHPNPTPCNVCSGCYEVCGAVSTKS
jgi:hypothetical protein